MASESNSQELQKFAPEFQILVGEARAAMAQEDWTLAIKKWESALALNPADTEAEKALREALEADELAYLYNKGSEYYRVGQLREAYGFFSLVNYLEEGYKDVTRLMAEIEEKRKGERLLVKPSDAQAKRARLLKRLGLVLGIIALLNIVVNIIVRSVTKKQVKKNPSLLTNLAKAKANLPKKAEVTNVNHMFNAFSPIIYVTNNNGNLPHQKPEREVKFR
jgi:tetratricopeptide (TPR) repeat protein